MEVHNILDVLVEKNIPFYVLFDLTDLMFWSATLHKYLTKNS